MSIHVKKNSIRATGEHANNLLKAFQDIEKLDLKTGISAPANYEDPVAVKIIARLESQLTDLRETLRLANTQAADFKKRIDELEAQARLNHFAHGKLPPSNPIAERAVVKELSELVGRIKFHHESAQNCEQSEIHDWHETLGELLNEFPASRLNRGLTRKQSTEIVEKAILAASPGIFQRDGVTLDLLFEKRVNQVVNDRKRISPHFI
jgi:hypothetical protein